MGADHGIQILDTQPVQIGYQHLAVLPVAAVDEHMILAVFNEDGIRLAHVDIVNGEGVAAHIGNEGGEGIFCLRFGDIFKCGTVISGCQISDKRT